MKDELAGPAVAEFPATLSLRNWPFLVLLALLGALPAAMLARDGQRLAAGAVLLLAACGPALFGVVPGWLAHRLGATVRVDALHEAGLRVRFEGRARLWRWESLQIESDVALSLLTSPVQNRSLTLRHPESGKRAVLQAGVHGEVALEFAAERLAQKAA